MNGEALTGGNSPVRSAGLFNEAFQGIRRLADSTYQEYFKCDCPAVYEDNCTGTKEISYIHTDYQGSWLAITNSAGSLTNRYSYDAWERPRNPVTRELLPINITDALVNLNAMQPRFDRGYTGHEIMAGFNIINMNGRLYDPVLGRMLSPDNFVQMPDFTQNFNRYAYCYNNPLCYIDKDGDWVWLIPVAIAGVLNVVDNWGDITSAKGTF